MQVGPLLEGELAVAIKHVGSDQLHVGIAYPSNGVSILFHLGWHYELRHDTLNTSYSLARIKQPQSSPAWRRRIRQITALCEFIWARHGEGGLPYSFASSSSFSIEGDFLPGLDGAPGFTCATFVLAAFEAASFPLTCGAWPAPNDDDVLWQEYIAEQLYHDLDAPDGEALRDACGVAARYRPEHVAAAALAEQPPSTYDSIEESSRLIRRELLMG